jgi:hypothetical protein
MALFEANRMPPEERAAIDGYRQCAHNGLTPNRPDGATPPAATPMAR